MGEVIDSSVPIPLVEINRDGTIVQANEAFLSWWGCSPDFGELARHCWFDDEPRLQDILSLVDQAENRRWQGEIWLRKANQRIEPFLATFSVSLRGPGYLLIGQPIEQWHEARQQIEKLAKIPAAIPYFAIEIDREGNLLYANPAVQQFAREKKTTPDQLLPSNLGQVFGVNQLMSGTRQEMQVEVGDQVLRWIFFPAYQKNRLYGVGQDFTQRWSRIQKRETLWKQTLATIDHLPGAFFQLEVLPLGQIRVVYLSPKVSQMVPVNGEKLREDPRLFFDHLSSAVRRQLFRSIREFQAANLLEACQQTFELPFLRKSKTNREDYLFRAECWFEKLSPHILITGILTDLTPQSRAEKQFASERQRLNSLLANAPDIIFSFSPKERRFLYCSPAVETNLSIPSSEVEQDPDALLALMQRSPFWANEFDSVETWSEERCEETFAIDRPTGDRAHFQGTYYRFREDDSPIWRIGGILKNVTAEVEAKKSILRLQRLDSIGHLASGIAHEFNNLLGIICAHTELLELGGLAKPSQEKNIDCIFRSVDRGKSLVGQLSSFYRRTEETFQQIDLNAFVGEVQEMVNPVIPKGIALEFSAPTDLPALRIDATAWQQVLLNLLINARDAVAPQGTIRFSAYLEKSRDNPNPLSEDACGYVVFKVEDTGVGIAPEVQPKIFDPFFTTKEVGKGSGLGLSVVHNIVTNAGGFIDVESVPGEGTRFLIYLPIPLIGEKAELPSPMKAPEHPLVFSSRNREEERILYIEDEEDIREPISAYLEDLGLKVDRAAHYDQARAAFQINGANYGLIISDLEIPGGSVVDLLEIFRAAHPATPIFVLSGYFDPLSTDLLEQLGVEKMISKPVTCQALGKAVRSILKI